MLDFLLTGRARLITHITGWALVFFTFFYLISWLRSPGEALARSVVNVLFLAILFYTNGRLIVNQFWEKRRFRQAALITLLFWPGMALLRTWVEMQVFDGGLFGQRLDPDQKMQRLFLTYCVSFFLLLLFSTLYQMLENRQTLELRHRELQARHAEAQLNYLKAQINPHFLFNTLNNIYAAATLQHPKTADMVLRLSDLLRYVTYDAQARQVPLARELAQVQAYIDLYQLKSEGPLPIVLQVAGSLEEHLIEPVLLLPLVENALKHGDLEHSREAFVAVTLDSRAERLFFQVKNTFAPTDKQKDAVGGVGLDNIRRRLELNHPGRFRFDTKQIDNIFTATLEIEY